MSYTNPSHSPVNHPSIPTDYFGASDADREHSTYLHATLERIDQLANDVEMRDPPLEEQTYLVLDTNILLHHFEVIQQFITDIEALNLPVRTVIPGAVINELDGQKNRDGLSWFARRASAWLLKKVKERKSVKGQAQEETCKSTGSWKVPSPEEIAIQQDGGTGRKNDYLIYDCCGYLMTARKGRVHLCSGDNNLCLECENVGIPTIQPTRQWRSRDIAQAVFGDTVDVLKFGTYHLSYRPEDTGKSKIIAPEDPDGMDIDDYPGPTLEAQHPLDLLHVQIIDHFTRLLVELVGRVGGSEVRKTPSGGAATSQYAPKYSKVDYTEWSAADCLEYLDSKKRRAGSEPRLDVFLSLPRTLRGSRRGQDWHTQAWINTMHTLASFSDLWDEPSIKESVHHLAPHLPAVFSTKMRPTGT